MVPVGARPLRSLPSAPAEITPSMQVGAAGAVRASFPGAGPSAGAGGTRVAAFPSQDGVAQSLLTAP